MSIVALGTFDGMHSGHQALLRVLRETAEKQGCEALIHTFANHPRAVFARAPKRLYTDAERLRMLRDTGCRVVADTFTAEYAAHTPEEFVRSLKERFAMQVAVTGFNYSFGRAGEGDAAMLEALGKKHGFACIIVPPQMYGGAPVSATRIRSCVEAGAVEEAAAMLARPFSIDGEVVKNRAIGRRIGFPTANILPAPELVLPRMGVYAALAHVQGKCFEAVTNVGDNPTVEGRRVMIETHLLTGGADLYGKEMRVEFIRFLRPQRRFESVAELRAQIARDRDAAQHLFQARCAGAGALPPQRP